MCSLGELGRREGEHTYADSTESEALEAAVAMPRSPEAPAAVESGDDDLATLTVTQVILVKSWYCIAFSSV